MQNDHCVWSCSGLSAIKLQQIELLTVKRKKVDQLTTSKPPTHLGIGAQVRLSLGYHLQICINCDLHYTLFYSAFSGGFRGGASAARAPPPPAQSHAHNVGFFKSFKTSPSLSKSVQRFKSYRLLKFSTQKPPEIPIFVLDILKIFGGAPPLLGPLDPPLCIRTTSALLKISPVDMSCQNINSNCQNLTKK